MQHRWNVTFPESSEKLLARHLEYRVELAATRTRSCLPIALLYVALIARTERDKSLRAVH